jgi:hypothetical protein
VDCDKRRSEERMPKNKKDKVRVAGWCWGEDWCPHLLDRLVHGRLVSANGEHVLIVRICLLNILTGGCLSD